MKLKNAMAGTIVVAVGAAMMLSPSTEELNADVNELSKSQIIESTFSPEERMVFDLCVDTSSNLLSLEKKIERCESQLPYKIKNKMR